MLPQFDHLVVYVSDLEEAIKDFTALGFEVSRGGSHGMAENALIIFSNQVYIELLALVPAWYSPLVQLANRLGVLQWLSGGKGSIRSRIFHWFREEFGPVDWCVRVGDIEATVKSWKQAGLDMLHSDRFSRKPVEGDDLYWYLGGTRSFDLPFLLEDISLIDDRIAPLKSGVHPNGASELRHIMFRVNSKATSNSLVTKFLSQDAVNGRFRLGRLTVSFEDQPMPCKVSIEVSQVGLPTKQVECGNSQGIDIQFCSPAEPYAERATKTP